MTRSRFQTGQRHSPSDGECQRAQKAAGRKFYERVAGPADSGPSAHLGVVHMAVELERPLSQFFNWKSRPVPGIGPTSTAVRRESGGRPGAALGDAGQIADSRSADEELALNVLPPFVVAKAAS